MLTFVVLLLIATPCMIDASCDGGNDCCKGQCGQGEGDCDAHSDCLPGLVCEFDGWWGDDWCRAGPDTTNYEWAAWGDWTDCSLSCGGDGTQTRTRNCIPPTNGGYECPEASQTQTQTCNGGPCPVDGGWGDWTDWTECPVSCGGGEHTRTRVCDNPAPAHGGNDCTGDGSQTETCNVDPCPIDGGWGEWSEWAACSVTCGGGEQGRTRVCDSPAPEHGGLDCTSDGSTDSDSQACSPDPCPINGMFSTWDEWTPCTAQCGGGDQTRARRCDSPAPQFGGDDCTGELTECQRCNTELCPSQCPAA